MAGNSDEPKELSLEEAMAWVCRSVPDPEVSCAKCKYFEEFDCPTYLVKGEEPSGVDWDGWCRRFPPVGACNTDGFPDIPIVSANDWCGEFRLTGSKRWEQDDDNDDDDDDDDNDEDLRASFVAAKRRYGSRGSGKKSKKSKSKCVTLD